MKYKAYKAVIFDLDGTLLDTIDDLSNSMNAVLKKSGYPEHTTEAYKYFVGNGLRNLVKRALPEGIHSDENIDRFLNLMREEYARRWDEKTRPYEGIPELLTALKGKNIKTAILSNKADNFTRLIADKILSRWKFEAVFGERPSVPKKPDPTGALQISKLLNIPVEEFLYLGDTNVDMITAVSAGMYPVGVLWGFRKADELLKGGAKVLISKPADLLDLL